MDGVAFEARNISKAFGVVQALRNVSLSVRPGEVHAIVGENGAGKSTLMSIFCGRLRPSKGALFVGGEPANFRSPADAREAGVGIAPQEINLVPALSVLENITLGAEHVTGLAINRKRTREEALSHLYAVDDTIDGHARVGTLSKAQQQLVQIARTVADPADAIARGLVYLPEERKQEGIFPLLSIAENLTIAALGRFRGPVWMNFRAMAATVEEYVAKLRIKIGSPRDPITSLSGGNQQKVILGRWLFGNAKILILDEPTRGIDVAAKSEIQSVLDALTAEGLSIVYISSELEEVLSVSDRVLVMHEGAVKGTPRAEDCTQESLLRLAMS